MQKLQSVPIHRIPSQEARGRQIVPTPKSNGGSDSNTRPANPTRPKPNAQLSAFEAEMFLEWSMN